MRKCLLQGELRTSAQFIREVTVEQTDHEAVADEPFLDFRRRVVAALYHRAESRVEGIGSFARFLSTAVKAGRFVQLVGRMNEMVGKRFFDGGNVFELGVTQRRGCEYDARACGPIQ